jgi:hypothetical protein
MAPQCYANPNPIYQPAMRLIASITNANPAVVTTTFANQYKNGLIVRLDIPTACGMQQANGMTGAITIIDDTSFYIAIDTTLFDTFAIPVSPPNRENICAQVVPVGEINETLINAVQNVLPFSPL